MHARIRGVVQGEVLQTRASVAIPKSCSIHREKYVDLVQRYVGSHKENSQIEWRANFSGPFKD